MSNDPWADALAAAPPKITAHQVGRIIRLIEDYTAGEAAELIATLAARNSTPGTCSVCKHANYTHSATCPTQGRD